MVLRCDLNFWEPGEDVLCSHKAERSHIQSDVFVTACGKDVAWSRYCWFSFTFVYRVRTVHSWSRCLSPRTLTSNSNHQKKTAEHDKYKHYTEKYHRWSLKSCSRTLIHAACGYFMNQRPAGSLSSFHSKEKHGSAAGVTCRYITHHMTWKPYRYICNDQICCDSKLIWYNLPQLKFATIT